MRILKRSPSPFSPPTLQFPTHIYIPFGKNYYNSSQNGLIDKQIINRFNYIWLFTPCIYNYFTITIDFLFPPRCKVFSTCLARSFHLPCLQEEKYFLNGRGFPLKFFFFSNKTDMKNFFVPIDVIYLVEHSKMRKDAPQVRNRKKTIKFRGRVFSTCLARSFHYWGFPKLVLQ